MHVQSDSPTLLLHLTTIVTFSSHALIIEGIQEVNKLPKTSCPAFQSAISSVQFSLSVVSNSFRPHESQHARPPCPSPTPGVHPDSCPSSQWCHPPISSSVIPFSSCPHSLPASGSFPMSQLFAGGGQSIGSFSFSISPSNEHSEVATDAKFL